MSHKRKMAAERENIPPDTKKVRDKFGNRIASTKTEISNQDVHPLCTNLDNLKFLSNPEKNIQRKRPVGVSKKDNSEESTKNDTGRFLKDFMDISVLGHGAYGRVYKAWSNKDQKNFAVKIVGNSKKSEREVKALARLQHHNIVKYFCCWEEDNKYEQESSESSDSSTSSSTNFLYIQMELCEGGTLRDWIEAKNSTPCPARRQEARNIIEQITDGLAFIHSKKLVHRDLKPENIFFEEQKIKIKIGDFGLVKNIALNTDESPPEGHESFGTPTYMSPEQKSGGLYGKKADIFALGLIFFELLWTLQTQMEKYTIWTDLRDQMFPEHFNVQFPPECKLIKMMLCKKTKKRPGAAGLLTEIKKLY